MSKWLKIGVPVLIAVLLITATVGITLAIAGKGVGGQAVIPAYASGQGPAAQYARGPQCSSCAGNGQGAVTGDLDGQAANANTSSGATCPSCPGYNAGTGGKPAVASRGGCCGGR